MMPLVAMSALSSEDSNHSSSRSAALMVKSLVMSAAWRELMPERCRSAKRTWSARSAERYRSEIRRCLHQERAEEGRTACEPGRPVLVDVGIRLREPGQGLAEPAALALVIADTPRPRLGGVGARHGHDLVPEGLETQVADDRRRHEAHHVGEGRDLDVGVLRERGGGVGGAARLVTGLEHHDLRPHLGEIRSGDEAVVASADDDHVVPIRSHQRFSLVPGQLGSKR